MISVSHEESLLKAVFEMIADENTVMIKAAVEHLIVSTICKIIPQIQDS